MSTDDTNAARRGSGSSDLLGQAPTRAQVNAWMAEAGWQNSAIRQADLDKVERVVRAAVAAERERWTKRVEEAFYEGFSSPETYNDTPQNIADEAWAKAKASLLRA